jgi:hypothetical protein
MIDDARNHEREEDIITPNTLARFQAFYAGKRDVRPFVILLSVEWCYTDLKEFSVTTNTFL